MMKEKAIFSWSSGKDSALALDRVLQNDQYEITALFTSVNTIFQRVSMHGVPVNLLRKQAESLNIPLIMIEIPEDISMDNYSILMADKMSEFKRAGVTHSVFGDIFLDDLRIYRENQLAKVNMKGVFPLWKENTGDLIREFLGSGFKTIVTCVNEIYLDKSFAGRIIDEDFIKDLPGNVDPCGENGEFHTFTFDGPIFKNKIDFTVGETVKKTYPKPKTDNNESTGDYVFWFCDIF